jgi:hypothetical protein
MVDRESTAMLRLVALTLVVLLGALLVWVLLQEPHIAIFVDGEKLVGPAKLAAEGWGLLVAIVALFSVATLLAFVVAGVGMIVLGALVVAGFLAAWLAFPFLLPLLIPLLIVWLFVAIVRRR